MNLFNSLLSATALATAAIAATDLVGFDNLGIAADDAPVKGVALNPAAAGENFPVMVIGSIRIKAAGAINAGDKIVSSATRGAVKAGGVDPANAFALALTSAADGEFVEILIAR